MVSMLLLMLFSNVPKTVAKAILLKHKADKVILSISSNDFQFTHSESL